MLGICQFWLIRFNYSQQPNACHADWISIWLIEITVVHSTSWFANTSFFNSFLVRTANALVSKLPPWSSQIMEFVLIIRLKCPATGDASTGESEGRCQLQLQLKNRRKSFFTFTHSNFHLHMQGNVHTVEAGSHLSSTITPKDRHAQKIRFVLLFTICLGAFKVWITAYNNKCLNN